MKRLTVLTGLLLISALLILTSCGAAEEKQEEDMELVTPGDEGWGIEERPPVIIERPETAPPPPTVVVVPPGSSGLGMDETLATERMIVRAGDISLVVEDITATIDQITAMVDGLGGYVVNSIVWKEGERLVGSISIRIPVEYFDNTMKSLRSMAVDVTSESSTSQDVTEEYVDLSAQLQNLEATEAQLLEIMKKAESVEDILNVQRELSRTRGEIEQTKARMQYLERTSATSIINVYLQQSKLDVDFFSSTRRLKEGEDVRFYNEVAGGFTPYSFQWDFGDGNTSTENSPTHTYKNDGTYTISLTVTDDRGNTDSETRTDYITVLPGWSAGSIASSAWNGMVAFGQVLADIFIWLGIFSPVWIVIGGLIIFWRRRRKKVE